VFNLGDNMNFDSIEIRKCKNGFVLTLNTEDGNEEYVFDTSRKALKFIKEYIEAKPAA